MNEPVSQWVDNACKLARFLESLPKQRFSLEGYGFISGSRGCGTVACALGWAPEALDDACPYTMVEDYAGGELIRKDDGCSVGLPWAADKLFGMSSWTAHAIFMPHHSTLAHWRRSVGAGPVIKALKHYAYRTLEDGPGYGMQRFRHSSWRAV